MKQTLLILLLFPFYLISATPKVNPPTGPSIGLIMQQIFSFGNLANFRFTIKNTGDEVLTNIYVTNLSPNSSFVNIYTNPTTVTVIASLAPGEENTTTFTGDKPFNCFDQSQVMVHATTLAATEITDLSSDSSYYSDNPTYSMTYPSAYGSQQGTYNDANNNSIVDVGDVINYTYSVNSFDFVTGIITDSNALITGSYFSGTNYFTIGIHYITQAEVDLGYVYNASSYFIQDGCGNAFSGSFYDESQCSCPNPNNANVVTPITSALPNRISGTVKYNLNNDNCATAITAPSRRINTADTNNNTYSSYTDATGAYHILIPNSGSYTTTALSSLGVNYSSTPASVAVTSSGAGQDYNNSNFCISSSNGFADLSVGMYSVSNAVPGSLAGYTIYYYNNGMVPITGSIKLNFNNAFMTFNNGSTLPDSTTSNSLTWNFTNLLPFQSRSISLGFNISTGATINQALPFTVTGNSIVGDNYPADNLFSWTQTVRSSFDPNDKTVIEGAVIGQAGNYLNYVTRFQNTGTANATTVVIKEMLDPNLDWSTFEPLASSHPSNIQIKNGNDITYTFSNIDLPYESANEPASHGWMAYRIKSKSTLAMGQSMSSTSDIYFDYNPPIVTNTVTTLLSTLSVKDTVRNTFSIYPNPTSHYLLIKAETPTDAQYEIRDINGKLLIKGQAGTDSIDVSALQNGFYFLTLKTSQEKASYKFIKN